MGLEHHLIKVKVAILVKMAHDSGSLSNCYVVTDADQVIISDIQGVNHHVLANVSALWGTECRPWAGLLPVAGLVVRDSLTNPWAQLEAATCLLYASLPSMQCMIMLNCTMDFRAPCMVYKKLPVLTMHRSHSTSMPVARSWSAHTIVVMPTILST